MKTVFLILLWISAPFCLGFSAPAVVIPEESNFWYTKLSIEQAVKEPSTNDRPLPDSAYYNDLCRLQLDITNCDYGVVQKHLEKQYTNWYYASNNMNTLKELHEHLPPSILRNCYITLPLDTRHPSSGNVMNTFRDIRSSIICKLSETGLEHINNVQLSGIKGDDACVELLQILQDLVYEGLIESVSIEDLSDNAWNTIKANRLYHLVAFRTASSNVLDPIGCERLPTTPRRQKPPLFISNPLLDGWLQTSKSRIAPNARFLTAQQQLHFGKIRNTPWAKQQQQQHITTLWEAYQTRLMIPLQTLADYHRVNIETLMIYWALQTYNGVIVDANTDLSDIIFQDLNVLEDINTIVGVPIPTPAEPLDISELYARQSSSGLFLLS